MKNIIKEIYWQLCPKQSRYADEKHRISCNEGQLKKSLTKHQQNLLRRIMDDTDLIIEDTGVDKFADGFKYGVKLMLEVMLK